MLKLENITKNYEVGDQTVCALKGVSVAFRKSEFVSVLGPSGCGKTTLLNLIGGLDRYSGGELIIDGRFTRQYKSRDWDSYRNHRIGFVFQSYNLIPHQTVLSNVELALTLSGVSKSQRRKRAVEALKKVGLADQLYKKPNQMSGGQMQRVAIARALINDPEILLCDEPTGALDSKTSEQIMQVLKEISRDKLIIMVTHNPQLAEEYSTRIIRLLDGKIVSDSDPFDGQEEPDQPQQAAGSLSGKKPKRQKVSMSFFTALGLSLNNLMTKKARTFLTSFAGSIGIIGIAMILSISSGVDAYIKGVERETLTSYPVTIEQATMDLSGVIESYMGSGEETPPEDPNRIYSSNIMTGMVKNMMNGVAQNDLKSFRQYLMQEEAPIRQYVSDIRYTYSTPMYIFCSDTSDGVIQSEPADVLDSLNLSHISSASSPMAFSAASSSCFRALIHDEELLAKQYEVLAGRMPQAYNEIVIIADQNNAVSDYALYALGLKDRSELKKMTENMINGLPVEESEQTLYSFDELMSKEYKLVVNTDFYEKEDGVWTDKRDNEIFLSNLIGSDRAIALHVVGICRATDAVKTTGCVGYTDELNEVLINRINDSEIVREQKENEKVDVFTGLPFAGESALPKNMQELEAYADTLPEAEAQQFRQFLGGMQASGKSEEQILETVISYLKRQQSTATYAENLATMGVADLENPSQILIYPIDFDAKEKIADCIREYNNGKAENERITYTDYIALMLSSVTKAINAISYLLIAFVAISLVVSSIMIGIITYISVLERTKEIGILRAIGASKKDISRVFNAETLIIGFSAGVFGILLTLLLNIPVNRIIEHYTGIASIASLPVAGAVILILISMLLTLIAGLLPARIAASKDPVIALRSE